ncbi:MAG TPA: hypothetical protein VEV83_07385 [Parafilimonas sp.]|nr:hypothetical protein [Parafilimonas sp.]
MRIRLLLVFAVCAAHSAFTQPAVRDEPRHHNVFENDHVRVLDVYLPPGDTTQYHVHATPSVFITFTRTVTTSQLMGQTAATSTSVAGMPWYDSLVTPRIHRVWNDDTSWFHVMDVELTGGSAHTNPPAVENVSLQLLFDEPLVRVYKAQLAAGNNINFPLSKAGYLVISTGNASLTFQTGGIIQQRLMKAGHYCWLNEASTVTSNTSANLLILQLK